MNSIAHEVAVIATGARPGESGGQRELFTEETSTVLVFENGGVLRLSAAVATGQLLFLTNKGTRREVVARVTRKRDFRPTSCYVEVEFSEPSPGFWGIAFPETPELVPANPQQQEAAELAQAAEAISDEPAVLTTAPSAHEVTALKQEVEALREQLKLLQTQTGAGNSSAPAATLDPPRAPAQTNPPNEESPELPSAATEAPTIVGVTAPRVAAALPIDRAEHPFSEEDLRTKPVIRINRAKPQATRPPKPKATSGVITRPGALRIGLLSAALLLIAAGAAWYLNWIPWLPQPKRISAGAASSIAAHPAPTVSSASPTTQQSAPRPSTLAAPEPPAPGDAAVDAVAVQEKSVVAASAGKRSVLRPSSKAAADWAAPSSKEALLVPPKLIKSVRAIASPNALQYFDTSNTATVTLDAVVDSFGRVNAMKFLAGPASLRDAAMDALKQYRYEPATRRGKPVTAHVTVTVKFLFEP